MAYDYKRYFGEIAVLRALTSMPEEARWPTTAPAETAERPIAIEHSLSVFARGVGIEFEDTFKTYRLCQDPERVLAETTPCQRANNVDAALAREVVRAAFGPLPSARGAATSLPS